MIHAGPCLPEQGRTGVVCSCVDSPIHVYLETAAARTQPLCPNMTSALVRVHVAMCPRTHRGCVPGLAPTQMSNWEQRSDRCNICAHGPGQGTDQITLCKRSFMTSLKKKVKAHSNNYWKEGFIEHASHHLTDFPDLSIT